MALMALVVSLPAHASTIIDFDAEAVGPANPLLIDGFRFLGSGPSEIIEQSAGDNALYLQVSGSFDDFNAAGPLFINLTAQDGSPFAFYGADFTATAAVAEVLFGIAGYVVGGGVAAGPIGTGDWLNLERVEFGVASCCGIGIETLDMTIDNVNVSIVPIPGAVWLFGSALGLLGWVRRRQLA